ncbi:tumor necrosis factor receptor type 1-associated DEATH domain protein-like [Caloenas nicobarica]|uniref:tumor necrosis factor receptor type 1-associated DEATH domain protein-like n=1 Tax=Caloenas nicobarica TaxID=187106 RepID=UPI0032B6FA8C
MAQGERELLLSLVRELSEEQFQSIKFLLEEQLPRGELLPATRPDLCRLLLQRFPGQALAILNDLLPKISRHDLVRPRGLPGTEREPPGEEGDARGHPISPPSMSSPAAHPPPAAHPRRLTEKDLMQIAQKLGKEWQEVGIVCLGLERSRLDQIREDYPRSVVLQSFEMLLEWQRREKQEATAPRLRACLDPASLDHKVFDLLRSFEGD